MKLAGWLLALVVFAYVAWGVGMGVWQYATVAGVVDSAVQGAPREARRDDREAHVRGAILTGAAKAGVPVGEQDVAVAADERALTVRVRWGYVVEVVRGAPAVRIPLSVERRY